MRGPAAVLILSCLLFPCGARKKSLALEDSGARPLELTRRVYLMGTPCTFTVVTRDRAGGLARLESLVRAVEETEEELSTWRPDSALSKLNRLEVGVSFEIEPRLYRLFEELRSWSAETSSAFDPAIGRLIHAWNLQGSGRWPDPDALKEALESSGMRHIRLLPGYQILRARDVMIDAGAFGKGVALDRLRSHSLDTRVRGWMVDLGGQVMVSGETVEGFPWKIDVAHPEFRDQRLVTMGLSHGSLATSAGSERDVSTPKGRIGHILDPRTGRPAHFRGSVTVWHESGLVADILSTALFVMGPEAGLEWAATRNIAVCFAISGGPGNSIEIRSTPSFRPWAVPEPRHPIKP